MERWRHPAGAGRRHRSARLLCSILALAMLPACTEMRWRKPGADGAGTEKQLTDDLQECRQAALLEARHEEIPAIDPPLTLRADPQGRAVAMPATPAQGPRFLREQDLTALCMRRKGYALVPASH